MKKLIPLVASVVIGIIFYYFFSGNVNVSDSNTNHMNIDFNFNHQVLESRGKNITIFSSPDNYLIEFNRPRIPLYSKEIELPENASLDSVELKDSEMKTYENVDVDFVPMDIYFVPENGLLMGFYPEQILWHNVFETLDGKKRVEIIAAPMQYNNQTKQARIYSSMKIEISYKNNLLV